MYFLTIGISYEVHILKYSRGQCSIILWFTFLSLNLHNWITLFHKPSNNNPFKLLPKIRNILQLKYYLNTNEKVFNGHWNYNTQNSAFYEQLEKYQQGEGESWWNLFGFGTNTDTVTAQGFLFHSFDHFYCLLQMVYIILVVPLTAYNTAAEATAEPTELIFTNDTFVYAQLC